MAKIIKSSVMSSRKNPRLTSLQISKKKVAAGGGIADTGDTDVLNDDDIEDFDAPPGITRAEAAKKPEPLFWNDEYREEMADADYEEEDYEEDEDDYEEDEDDYEDDF